MYLLQAGSPTLPEDLVPSPNQPNDSMSESQDKVDKKLHVPDYVFLLEHLPTKQYYIFNLGMRRGLENPPPYLVKNVLPQFDCEPVSPADTLHEHGTEEQRPENVKAVIFSHQHFGHVGAGHQMMLVRAKSRKGTEDEFVVLAGDCYHHPILLEEPERTARPPYSKESMHADLEQVIDSIACKAVCRKPKRVGYW